MSAWKILSWVKLRFSLLQHIHQHKTNIMAGFMVFTAWISQTYNHLDHFFLSKDQKDWKLISALVFSIFQQNLDIEAEIPWCRHLNNILFSFFTKATCFLNSFSEPYFHQIIVKTWFTARIKPFQKSEWMISGRLWGLDAAFEGPGTRTSFSPAVK